MPLPSEAILTGHDHAPEARAPGSTVTAIAVAVVPVIAVLLLALVLHFIVGPALAPFPRRILVEIGITIVLAVSLNIVNGYTGQFSIGHAAFMTAGGYAAVAVTYYGSLLAWDATPSRGGIFGQGELLVAGACVVGGIVAAGLGW